MQKGEFVNKGKYILVKRIEDLDEFWEAIHINKSIFARHRIYPSAFFFSWQLRMIKSWINLGYFWTAKRSEL